MLKYLKEIGILIALICLFTGCSKQKIEEMDQENKNLKALLDLKSKEYNELEALAKTQSKENDRL